MIQLQCFSKPGQHPRELNPYWKDGGSGLPQHKPDSNSHEHPGDSRRERPSESTRERSGDSTKGHSGARVGDGGRSWMLRSYKRAVQQAETEGRSLEQIAAERWGSLEKLHSLLRAAGIDPENPDHPPKTGRREYLYSAHPREEERRRKDWKHRETPSRLPTDHKSSREVSGASGFLKPGEADMKLSSRRSEASSSAGRSSSISQGWRKRKEAWEDPQDEGKKLSHDYRSSSPKEKPSSHLAPPSSPQKIQEEREVESPSMDVPSEPVTDSQLNAIGAKLMKAELMGDSEKAESLKEELAKLRKQKELQESGRKGGQTQYKGPREETTIVLTKTDRFGRTRPVELPSTTGYRQPGPSKTRTHSKKGKREKYFADDDEYNLKSLMEQERQMTAEETHAAIARMASKFVPASNMDETVDDAFDSKAAMRFDPAKEEEKRKQRAILESRKMAEILENCYFCFDSPNFSKHLLVAIGISTYLSVPFHQSLTEGHCLIVPMEHTVCSMQMDENVWSEVRIFQKGLTRMFADHDMDVVFMETYSSTKSKSHMSIECIPVPREEGELAPMYFKKAILESDEEWSQNKKLIDTRQKGVRNSIPSGLPYFFVEFGMDGGYGHIIEDQTKFPHYFGREVVGGLVDAEPRLWLKPHKESFETQKQKVLKLSEWWKPYDWTQKLKEK